MGDKAKTTNAKIKKSVTTKSTVVNINSPKALSEFAIELKSFIVGNDLFTGIKNKNYVHVEGWQFAGASMGLFPVVKVVENISDDKNIKYRAEVEIVQLSTGKIVGYGVAMCSDKEDKKKSFDEYAIASMAQTRAVGKAFRLCIGWIMKLSGYEPTPMEEMSNKYSPDENPVEAEIVETQIPFEDVKALVDMKLASLDSASKIRVLKDTVSKLDMKKLTERDYRLLYSTLTDMANRAKEAETQE